MPLDRHMEFQTDARQIPKVYPPTLLGYNYRKMTILWSFSCISFVKIHGKRHWEPQNDGVVNPNACYNQVFVCLV